MPKKSRLNQIDLHIRVRPAGGVGGVLQKGESVIEVNEKADVIVQGEDQETAFK